jgi:histidine decarboxylase
MENLENTLKDALATFIGYPCNTSYDFSEVSKFINIHINNLGNPECSSTYKANTKHIEREVLGWFADLWGIDKEKCWGVLTNGGTESSLQGLYVARESSNGKPHVFLTSKDSHYGIYKIAKLLNLNIVRIESRENGELDYQDFTKKVQEHLDKYIIVNVNLGTTMKGAIDSSSEVYRILKKYGKQNEYYMHADGALAGAYIPFLERDLLFKAHVNSMAISGHKFFGLPFPSGIFMMERKFLKYIVNNIECIGSNDCTISGSRNGHSAIFLKHVIDTIGYDGFKKDVDRCIELAEYLVDNIDGAWRNHNSITVVIPRPNELIIKKWQLATENDISHVICMPHVTREKLDAFIKDVNSCKE